MPQYPDKLIDLDGKNIDPETEEEVAKTIKHEVMLPTAKELWQKYREYLAKCDRTGRRPNMAGYCSFFGTHLKRMADWAKNEKLAGTINRIRTDLLAKKMEMAETGEIRGNIFIFDAVNTLGAITSKSEDKREEKHSGKVGIEITRKVVK